MQYAEKLPLGFKNLPLDVKLFTSGGSFFIMQVSTKQEIL